ncbi:MAG: hypothetical protein AAF548_01010, partial [Actinomycetota bacterium]
MPTAFAAAEIELDALIDLDAFPIHDVASPTRADLVTTARDEMRARGCFRIADFVRPDAIVTMAQEASRLHDQTFWSIQDHNPYFSPDDESFPDAHPRRRFQRRESGFINSDILDDHSLLRYLYDTDVLLHFIWECLGTPQPIYRWADPLGRNPYGVMEPGHYLPWHFDGNEFTVSVLVQKAESGGVFEYVPGIRSPEAENYDHIRHILDGGRDGVHELDLQPGDLQLFAGRFSMHRVTPIGGDTTRYVGLPTYVHDPYRMNRPYHSESIYGRATDLHLERAQVLV